MTGVHNWLVLNLGDVWCLVVRPLGCSGRDRFSECVQQHPPTYPKPSSQFRDHPQLAGTNTDKRSCFTERALAAHAHARLLQSTSYKETEAELTITVTLTNREQVGRRGAPAGPAHTCALLVGDADNNVVYKAKIRCV